MPSYYDRDGADKLTVFVTIAPSIKEYAKADPLFVLAGGPGQAGSEITTLVDNAFRKIRQNRDIVFIDQRGTGRSGKLLCAQADQIDELPPVHQDAAIAQCLREIPGDKNAYSTANAARDIDTIRQTLGYTQINVWGGSYGTRLAQAYARLFPDNTRSLILDGVASPQQLVGEWGRDGQASLDALFEQCRNDKSCAQTFPQLQQQWQQLLTAVSGDQFTIRFTHPRTGAQQTEVLTHNAFTEVIRGMLYDTRSRARLPIVISRAADADWGPFMQNALSASDFSTQKMAFGLTFSVLCGEDLHRVDDTVLAHEKQSSFLRDTTLRKWTGHCSLLNITRRETLDRSIIATPTLMLSGALDPVTPPTRAEEAKQFIPQAQHLIVANAGHIVSHMGCAPTVLKQFVDEPTTAVTASCLSELKLPSFVLNNAGAAP